MPRYALPPTSDTTRVISGVTGDRKRRLLARTPIDQSLPLASTLPIRTDEALHLDMPILRPGMAMATIDASLENDRRARYRSTADAAGTNGRR